MTLRVSKTLDLPISTVTDTIGILGVKGSGKTTTARVIVEQLTEAEQQCVIIDPTGAWWGLRSHYPFTILGGEQADIPLDPQTGNTVADFVVDHPWPVVLDMSLMRKGAMRSFALPFIETLYHRNRQPLMLVVDECDLFIPQRVPSGMEPLIGAMEDIVRRGRKRGIGVTLISQRPASVHKDVLSQVATLVTHRLMGAHDRKAIKDWVEANGDPESERTMLASLAKQRDGEAWVWSPTRNVFGQHQILQAKSFDSGATPDGSDMAPVKLRQIDVGDLQEAFATTIEKAKADDPKELRKRIIELEREIKSLADQQPETVEVEVRVEVVPDDVKAGAEDLRGGLERLQEELGQFTTDIEEYIALVDSCETPAPGVQRVRNAIRDTRNAIREPQPKRVETTREPRDDVHLKAGARRILETIARHHPMRLTQSQVGTLAKFKTSGGTFQSYKSALKVGGYIDIDAEGYWTATDLGLDFAGVSLSPMSVDEIREHWRSVLKAGARVMLDHLISRYPQSMTREDLAAYVSMTASGGTFQSYLSTLKANGLAVVDGQEVTASDTLFIGGN